jgi:hypothetical protein
MQRFCASQDGTVVAIDVVAIRYCNLLLQFVVAIRQRANMLDEIVWMIRIYPTSTANCGFIGY